MKYKAQIVQLLISMLAICAIAYVVNFADVLQALKSAKMEFVLGAIACYFAINLLMSYRIKVLLEDMGQRARYKDIVLAHFSGMLASDFTPARSGYFATAAVLATHKVPAGKAFASILSPQLFDFLLKVVAGAVAIAFMLSALKVDGNSILVHIAALAGIFIVLVFAVLLVFSMKFLLLLRGIFAIHPLGGKIWEMLASMQEHSKAVRRKLPFVLGLLFCTWMLKGVEWMLLGDALSLQPEFAYGTFVFYLLLQPLITILQFVPFPTLAGAGLSEAGAIGVMVLFGISAPAAAAFALLTRGIMIVVDLIGLAQIGRIDFEKILEKKAVE
ncbi:Lysylphosphatidylglycerol synthase TM region [Candidatus Anstonella stagnisolia]|nr:Lysylphosphatidylglycerol synthase TM region [Candidatus Anstonella stagnisolia]